uniref:Core domain-containing protein n=1 Tax=Hildenbrandia rubra TaxID=31481 RepID=A0A1C9CG41_9FLOR|nr:hypothetical protein Hrub_095 [Hildenbrandia rubra]AOM67339.1 hypothetical protein Hrub_095 [Hildenbrandia rubra]
MSTTDKQYIISITSNALDAINRLQKEKHVTKFLFRIGVKQGGCSGMSYVMHIEYPENITQNDRIINYSDFQIVCNFKSLLLLYGLSLDYNDEMVGGGFRFINPNATQTCGCGKSFTVDKI